MTTEMLKKYLKTAVELESRLYIQHNSIQQLESHIKTLGKSKKYYYPQKPVKQTKIRYKSGDTHSPAEDIFLSIFIGIFISLIGVAVLWFFSMFDVWKWFNPVYHIIGYGIIIAGVAAACYGIWDSVKDIKWLDDKYKQDMQNYEDNVAYTDELINDDKVRVASELTAKEHLLAELELLRTKYSETCALLQALYNLDIIFKKYRNFVAVCSFYEYLMSGRCTTLEGHEGAYNIYETEIRLDKVIAKLDDVISHLAKIEQNQYTLYDAINSGNESIRQLVGQTKKIAASADYSAKQSAITAENSRWAAEELDTLKWIEIIKLHQ